MKAKRIGMKIIYLDETMFTSRTYATHDYGLKHQCIEVDEQDVYISYVCAIAAISAEKGIEMIKTKNEPINGETFAEFLDELSKKQKR
jgi:hypothetical protein